MPVTEIDTADVADLDTTVAYLRAAAAKAPDAPTRAGLEAFADLLNARQSVSISSLDARLTPSEAASELGVSRTHLYKVMDRGGLPFENVGRDRRILRSDLNAYIQQRDAERRRMAWRAGNSASLMEQAVNDLLG